MKTKKLVFLYVLFLLFCTTVPITANKSVVPSIIPGRYATTQQLEFKNIKGLEVYYTTDGTAPTLKSKRFVSKITIDKTMQINYIVKSKGKVSKVINLKYIIDSKIINITKSTPIHMPKTLMFDIPINTQIYYTLDGSSPSLTSKIYTNGIYINKSCEVNCICVDKRNNIISTYTTKVNVCPNISQVKVITKPCSFIASQEILINVVPNIKVYYTLDGSEPTTQSLFYNGKLTITETSELKYIFIDNNDAQSSPINAGKYIKVNQLPSFSDTWLNPISKRMVHYGLLDMGSIKLDDGTIIPCITDMSFNEKNEYSDYLMCDQIWFGVSFNNKDLGNKVTRMNYKFCPGMSSTDITNNIGWDKWNTSYNTLEYANKCLVNYVTPYIKSCPHSIEDFPKDYQFGIWRDCPAFIYVFYFDSSEKVYGYSCIRTYEQEDGK